MADKLVGIVHDDVTNFYALFVTHDGLEHLAQLPRAQVPEKVLTGLSRLDNKELDERLTVRAA
eukprot:94510-Amorphochlora_amoeboformis.AAC.2